MVIDVPFWRALGGRNVRKSRAGFAHAENGLNLAVTSVINLVIILIMVARRAASNSIEQVVFYGSIDLPT